MIAGHVIRYLRSDEHCEPNQSASLCIHAYIHTVSLPPLTIRWNINQARDELEL